MGQAYKLTRTMTLMRTSNSMWPSLNNFFDDFITRDFFDNNWSNLSATKSTIPAVNISETKDDFMVEVAAPGMEKQDFHVELDNDILTISSEKDHSNEQAEQNFTRREFSYMSFKRSFNLPNSVEVNKIKAKYQDGVLRLVIPKKEEAKQKPVRQISIS